MKKRLEKGNKMKFMNFQKELIELCKKHGFVIVESGFLINETITFNNKIRTPFMFKVVRGKRPRR